jgi:hypothetical protein
LAEVETVRAALDPGDVLAELRESVPCWPKRGIARKARTLLVRKSLAPRRFAADRFPKKKADKYTPGLAIHENRR